MAKRNWKAVEISRTVRIPNVHVKPNRAITPMVLIVSLTTVFRLAWPLLANFLWICLVSTLITTTNTIALNSKMAKIGPRNAPKKTPGSLMKQLEGEKKCIHYCIQRAKQCNTKKLIFVDHISYNLIGFMLVVLLMSVVLIVLLIVGVIIKSRSIASGITTGTIGSTAMKKWY